MKKLLSVIVPVYNSEKYIAKCLASITHQTIGFDKIEIIVVNDGSTDKSEEIIKKIQGFYPNTIKYFSKENTGVADTRNFAIEQATGEYLAFVDSDDYIDINLYREIFEKQVIQQTALPESERKIIDIIKYKSTTVGANGRVVSENDGPIFDYRDGEEAFKLLYGSDKLLDALWVYLFRREFFIENKFKFTKGLEHEDFALIPLIIAKSKVMISIPVYGYYYIQTDSSITRNDTNNEEFNKKVIKRAYDLLAHYDNMIEKIKEYNISEESKQNIKIYYTNCILLEINNLPNKVEKEKYIKEIKNRKMVNNIKARDFKQFVKRMLLKININLYLKLRDKQKGK